MAPQPRAKYPRTWHLSISPGTHRDDRQHRSDDHLVGRDLVLSEKMDGSGVSLHHDGLYARSKQGPPNHPSYGPLKALASTIAGELDPGWSVFGEWCHTLHAIEYPQLPEMAELQLFAVRDDPSQTWWAWHEMVALADHLVSQFGVGLVVAPELWRGTPTTVSELHGRILEHAHQPSTFGPDREGIVVRDAGRFDDEQFPSRVAKWVREGHVTGEHWTRFDVRRHQQTDR